MPQYFDRTPAVASDTATFDVVLEDVSFSLTTDRGVFSHGHVDAGTGLLLRTATTPPPSGDLLDLGCGSGAIAMTLALRAPSATVWAIDVNSRALELTARNAERNKLANVRAVAPGEVPDDLTFDAIWSNPPIRIGKAALHTLLRQWMGRLRPEGVATLVVQKHLGADSLQAWLDAEGFPTERVASRQGFRVLASRRAA